MVNFLFFQLLVCVESMTQRKFCNICPRSKKRKMGFEAESATWVVRPQIKESERDIAQERERERERR